MSKVIIYTDGACAGNPGPGGWGAILMSGDKQKKICGGDKETTNNRMEITAALEALKSLKKPCDVELYTDSKYLIEAITKWLPGWKKNGWKTADKKPVKNQDLWVELEEVVNIHKIKWNWVKGHAGDKLNEMADELARSGIPR
jgi:ribonuclease HI